MAKYFRCHHWREWCCVIGSEDHYLYALDAAADTSGPIVSTPSVDDKVMYAEAQMNFYMLSISQNYPELIIFSGNKIGLGRLVRRESLR